MLKDLGDGNFFSGPLDRIHVQEARFTEGTVNPGQSPQSRKEEEMKKMKKFFAMFLALAMVLGMSVTTLAEGVTIKVVEKEGTLTAATLQYVQAIVADPEEVTGWAFTDTKIAEAYMNAFGVADAQKAIIMLAKNEKQTAYADLAIAEGLEAATAAQIDKALSNVVGIAPSVLAEMDNGMDVDSAGIYIIKAEESGFTYKNMSAYVGFGEADDGSYPALESAIVTVKKSSNTIGKENVGDAADNAVAVGDTVEFKVTSSFPFVDANATDKTYVIQDTLVGAEFNLSTVRVTIGEQDYTRVVTPALLTVKPGTNDEKIPDGTQILEIDLSGLIDDGNSLANEEVVITYSAIVKEVSATNTVSHSGTGITDSVPAETNLYTGSITITKYAEDQTTLPGAEFVVSRSVDGVLGYATFDENNKLTGWTPEIDEASRVKTGADGKATVNGLDAGTYHFIEVKAPEGYSINDDGAVAELKFVGDAVSGIFTGETSMTDTKLSSLPSTGGIGTTIFTVGGCAIMIIAAGLYFSLRRKTVK